MELICLNDINKSFKNIENTYTILNQVSLTVNENEVISIVGVSGSGKTTLLNIIADLENIDNGNIVRKRALKINYVTQYSHFIEELSILENLIFSSLQDKQYEQKIVNYCEQFNCTYLLNKKPSSLSGGEKQRINIIRSLLNQPDLIVLDEPTASLDYENKFKVIDTLMALQITQKISLIIVTHDYEIIRYLPHHSQYILDKKTLYKNN